MAITKSVSALSLTTGMRSSPRMLIFWTDGLSITILAAMTRFEFTKMHGLGNDFVIVDGRAGRPPSVAQIRAMSDRRRGIGCDQFLTLRAPTDAGAAVRMDIRNPDGSVAEACGNGTRCVAALLMEQSGDQALTIETVAGQLDCRRAGDGQSSTITLAVKAKDRPWPVGCATLPPARDAKASARRSKAYTSTTP
ncbi:MAG: hypothetical protein VYA68_01265, partial [Pseudomonadota bacterium]|nr:hypothetical protein [Pseudomonadota bacterium]